jgi:hypothetical protein
VFAKALLAQAAQCSQSGRRPIAEQLVVECRAPLARVRCEALAAMLRERARFVLRLPAGARPLLHQQALRLQCGGLTALRELAGEGPDDVSSLVTHALERHGDLAGLPWAALVERLASWQPPRRHGR